MVLVGSTRCVLTKSKRILVFTHVWGVTGGYLKILWSAYPLIRYYVLLIQPRWSNLDSFHKVHADLSKGIWEEFGYLFRASPHACPNIKYTRKCEFFPFLSLFGHNSVSICDDPKSSHIPLAIEVILMPSVQRNDFLDPSWSKMYSP